MHLISYFQQHEDAHEVQAALRLRFPSARIAMRAGWLWSASSNVEAGFTHIRAPGFPGILAAYAAAGVAMCEAGDLPRVAPPDEITELPHHEEISILSAGVNLRAEIAALPPRGLRMAINRAHIVGCDWHIANDGFSLAGMMADGDPVRACRLRHSHTLPGGRWFDIERIGVHEGRYTPVCALMLAQAMGAKVVWLYGHDLIPGPGVAGTGHESENALRDIAVNVDAEIARLRSDGITVHRVLLEGGQVTVDGERIGQPAPAATRGRKAKR